MCEDVTSTLFVLPCFIKRTECHCQEQTNGIEHVTAVLPPVELKEIKRVLSLERRNSLSGRLTFDFPKELILMLKESLQDVRRLKDRMWG